MNEENQEVGAAEPAPPKPAKGSSTRTGFKNLVSTVEGITALMGFIVALGTALAFLLQFRFELDALQTDFAGLESEFGTLQLTVGEKVDETVLSEIEGKIDGMAATLDEQRQELHSFSLELGKQRDQDIEILETLKSVNELISGLSIRNEAGERNLLKLCFQIDSFAELLKTINSEFLEIERAYRSEFGLAEGQNPSLDIFNDTAISIIRTNLGEIEAETKRLSDFFYGSSEQVNICDLQRLGDQPNAAPGAIQ